jgi:hypothetical protein
MKIRACIFYDETLHAPRRNFDIIVEDGLIAGVLGANGSYDWNAARVIPCLVNAHAHREQNSQTDLLGAIQTIKFSDRLLQAVSKRKTCSPAPSQNECSTATPRARSAYTAAAHEFEKLTLPTWPCPAWPSCSSWQSAAIVVNRRAATLAMTRLVAIEAPDD